MTFSRLQFVAIAILTLLYRCVYGDAKLSDSDIESVVKMDSFSNYPFDGGSVPRLPSSIAIFAKEKGLSEEEMANKLFDYGMDKITHGDTNRASVAFHYIALLDETNTLVRAKKLYKQNCPPSLRNAIIACIVEKGKDTCYEFFTANLRTFSQLEREVVYRSVVTSLSSMPKSERHDNNQAYASCLQVLHAGMNMETNAHNRSLLKAFVRDYIPFTSDLPIVFTITEEMLADMGRREAGAAHLHGRLVTSSPQYTNEFISPLTNYHSTLGLSEVEFATALFRYAQENMHDNTNLEYVVTALRALAATPETNTLPLVEALAQEDLPKDLVLPVASLLVAKKSSRQEVLSAPLVERMTPFERKCYMVGKDSVAVPDHIDTSTKDEDKSYLLFLAIPCLLACLGGIAIFARRKRYEVKREVKARKR